MTIPRALHPVLVLTMREIQAHQKEFSVGPSGWGIEHMTYKGVSLPGEKGKGNLTTVQPRDKVEQDSSQRCVV